MAVVAKADHSLRVVEITFRKPKKSDGQASRAEDAQPNLKWVVEWLVNLGVDRKTVALALRRERLTGRMTHAVQRLMANLDEPGWERTTPLDRLEARIKLVIETVDDLARLVDHLNRRVEALEEGRGESGNDAASQRSADAGNRERQCR